MILKGFGISLTRNGPDSLVQANFFPERVLAVHAALKSLLKLYFFVSSFYDFKIKMKLNLKKKMPSPSLKKKCKPVFLSMQHIVVTGI